jgi:hypothetical protein
MFGSGTQSLGGLNQLGGPLDKMELIVNAEPEIPLKVPLNKSVLRYDLKAKHLKMKNLERFEKVAINLGE